MEAVCPRLSTFEEAVKAGAGPASVNETYPKKHLHLSRVLRSFKIEFFCRDRRAAGLREVTKRARASAIQSCRDRGTRAPTETNGSLASPRQPMGGYVVLHFRPPGRWFFLRSIKPAPKSSIVALEHFSFIGGTVGGAAFRRLQRSTP